jgi:hypothetical protein
MCALHSRPDPSAIAEQLTERDGDGRGTRLALVEDIAEILARDPKQGGDLAPGLAGRRDNILAQQFAWVGRAPVPVALGSAMVSLLNDIARNRHAKHLRHQIRDVDRVAAGSAIAKRLNPGLTSEICRPYSSAGKAAMTSVWAKITAFE